MPIVISSWKKMSEVRTFQKYVERLGQRSGYANEGAIVLVGNEGEIPKSIQLSPSNFFGLFQDAGVDPKLHFHF